MACDTQPRMKLGNTNKKCFLGVSEKPFALTTFKVDTNTSYHDIGLHKTIRALITLLGVYFTYLEVLIIWIVCILSYLPY